MPIPKKSSVSSHLPCASYCRSIVMKCFERLLWCYNNKEITYYTASLSICTMPLYNVRLYIYFLYNLFHIILGYGMSFDLFYEVQKLTAWCSTTTSKTRVGWWGRNLPLHQRGHWREGQCIQIILGTHISQDLTRTVSTIRKKYSCTMADKKKSSREKKKVSTGHYTDTAALIDILYSIGYSTRCLHHAKM